MCLLTLLYNFCVWFLYFIFYCGKYYAIFCFSLLILTQYIVFVLSLFIYIEAEIENLYARSERRAIQRREQEGGHPDQL
jgi:hypothetical protein